MEEDFESELVVYQHEQLVVVGVTGTMERLLSGVAPLIKQRYPYIEIAPVQHQPGRDFLAMFMNNPPRDITIDQKSVAENAIVGYALNKKRLTETMGGIARVIGFIPHRTLNPVEAQAWKDELEFEKITYSDCGALSYILQKPLEAVFGMVRYSNFLNQYNNMTEEEANKLAARKFGIPLD